MKDIIKNQKNSINKQSLKQAVIWAEILGKPKALKDKEGKNLV